MSKYTKVKRSLLDKIIYCILAIASVVIFIWDIVKDFIPDKYWQLKLMIIIIGALSGFFTVLSFLWDKKFNNVAMEVSSSFDTKLNGLAQDIDTFIKEDFHSYESFNDAIIPILNGKNEFDDVKIFAYSAKNYVECLLRSNVHVKLLKLCLKRANDYSAWFVNNESRVRKYKSELEKVIEDLENLREKGQVTNYEIRFYDFESYSHFGIFDNEMLLGELIPLFSENKTVQIGKIQTLSNIGRNKPFFSNKILFFDKLFDGAGADSGLKLYQMDCHFCDSSKMIQDPHHVNGTTCKFGVCDISLIDKFNLIEDFLLEPDSYPISELHMLLVCKFHILNLYDYLCHKDAVKKLEDLVYKIRNVVFEKTGQEILLFEHGTSVKNSQLSGSSIEHLHIHIIYKPMKFNFIDAINEDNIKREKPIFDINRGMIKFSSLHEFAEESVLKNKDYFLIWKPGKNVEDGEIYVWLPIEKESQFLRRIFFQGLSDVEKEKLYGAANCKFDNIYDWKAHEFKYSDVRLKEHQAIGEAIQHEYEQN